MYITYYLTIFVVRATRGSALYSLYIKCVYKDLKLENMSEQISSHFCIYWFHFGVVI